MLKIFHVVHQKSQNFTQKNGILLQILYQMSFLTKIFLEIYLILQPETQNPCMYI